MTTSVPGVLFRADGSIIFILFFLFNFWLAPFWLGSYDNRPPRGLIQQIAPKRLYTKAGLHQKHLFIKMYSIYLHRVADVEGPRDWRFPKVQGLPQKEGPPTYNILSRNLVLPRFMRFLKGFHGAFYESNPDLGELATKVSVLLKGFQQKSACFQRAFREPAFGELS